MLVLAFDTATQAANVAVVRDGKLLAERESQVRAQHGESLLPLMQSCFREANVSLEDIELLAVGTGPGSFTGLRIGLATAKGLWLAKRMPIVGVGSLRALAASVADQGTLVVPTFDAFKGEVFAAVYERAADGTLNELLAPFYAVPARANEELAHVLAGRRANWVGDGVRKYGDAFAAAFGKTMISLEPTFDSPRGLFVAREGLARFQASGADDAATLEPVYVRPSDATFSLPAKN
ncbi:MAG: tRNA (adenosine(37)-N6)-threonylcarbamoyltransferase complex dimerization subunit type 1 TsaB [Sandaracinaceae bacterium]|nr:tRNA (adenosine(37)-N6)-threonylcarbamoyltransferase complex dimerization subunit type 1 TsaB [Sandaracinaceae bacterium]